MSEDDFLRPLESTASSLRQRLGAWVLEVKHTDAKQRRRAATTEAMQTKAWRLSGFWKQTLSLTLIQRVEHEVVKLEPCAVRRPTFTVHALPHS